MKVLLFAVFFVLCYHGCTAFRMSKDIEDQIIIVLLAGNRVSGITFCETLDLIGTVMHKKSMMTSARLRNVFGCYN